MSELHAREVLPIVVGGTTYYLQSLIFPNQTLGDPDVEQHEKVTQAKTLDDVRAELPDRLRRAVEALPTELLELFLVHPALPNMSTPDSFPPRFPVERLPLAFRTPDRFTNGLYRLLCALDPENARRWHWRDVRKIRRGIDLIWDGKTWADVVEAQSVPPTVAAAGSARQHARQVP